MVTLFSGFGTGSPSLCRTELVANGKLGYITICLYFEIIPDMYILNRNNSLMNGLLFLSQPQSRRKECGANHSSNHLEA